MALLVSPETPTRSAVSGVTCHLGHRGRAVPDRHTARLAPVQDWRYSSLDSGVFAEASELTLGKAERHGAMNAHGDELLPSLDRIDSDGHYVPGKLHIVCRFINRWKSDGDDKNFRRLLSVLRGRMSGVTHA